LDPREIAELDRLRAYEKLGVQRQDFLKLAESALEEIGGPLSRTHLLRPRVQSRMLALQRAVKDRDMRLLVCRLSAAVITADGWVTGDERQVYASLLGQMGADPIHGHARHPARQAALKVSGVRVDGLLVDFLPQRLRGRPALVRGAAWRPRNGSVEPTGPWPGGLTRRS
jgi:hypothetical protein